MTFKQKLISGAAAAAFVSVLAAAPVLAQQNQNQDAAQQQQQQREQAQQQQNQQRQQAQQQQSQQREAQQQTEQQRQQAQQQAEQQRQQAQQQRNQQQRQQQARSQQQDQQQQQADQKRQQQRQQQQMAANQRLQNEWGELSQRIDSGSTFYYPSGQQGDAVVRLDLLAPASIRAGEPAPYELVIENVTQRRLAGVTVVQDLSDGLEFEAAMLEGQQNQNQANNQNQNQQNKAEGQSNSLETKGKKGQQRWSLGELGPGESKTVRALAIPQSEGTQGMCVTVLYEPALCATFDVVSPTLKVSKDAPEQAYLCDDLSIQYTVQNTGDADARNVVITDELPEGLRTADGQGTIERDIGTLAAKDSETFTIQLQPQDTGEFTSRAIVKSDSGEVRSAKTTTTIVEPSLQVSASSTDWQYANQPVEFEATVKNTGDAAAREASLSLQLQGAQQADREQSIGNLAPGQSETVTITAQPTAEAGKITLTAIANSVCAQGESDARTAKATTEIRRLPALLLESVDNNDPVKVGSNTVYTIKVKNQGDAPADKVNLTLDVPQEMEIVNASGDAKSTTDGQQVTFGPIASLESGEVATFQLEAKANEAGDVKMRTELESEYLDQPVADVEPTRLY